MHPCGKIAQDHATFKTQRLMMCYSLADIVQQTCIRSDMVYTLVKTELTTLTTLRSSSTDNFFGAELKARIEIRSQTIQLYYTEFSTTSAHSNQHVHVHFLQCLMPAILHNTGGWSISARHHERPKISYMMDFVQIQKLKLEPSNVCCPIRLAFLVAFLWQHITIT